MPDATLNQLQAQLSAVRARWTAGITSVSKLSVENRRACLGLVLDEGELSRIQRRLTTPGRERLSTFAPERDWRLKDGLNWVTPAKDQGLCGSCVAQAAVGVMESRARIQFNKPEWNIDLSEAELFFCGAGRKCSSGWWPSTALEWAQKNGVCADDLFPYVDHDIDCIVPQGRSNKVMTVSEWREVIDVGERKQFLDSTGPMIACMAVYSDLYNYVDGVYHHVAGDLIGYHAVCCVGYSEKEGCWICKNSWGSDWGQRGFFKIAYGEGEIESRFAMYGVVTVGGTLKPDTVKPEPKPEPNPDRSSGQSAAQRIVVEQSLTSQQNVLWFEIGGRWLKTPIDETLTKILPELFASDQITISWEGGAIDRILLEKKFH